MSTLSEVAERSGASIATVSRVINGRSDLVAEKTRERVLAAMRELRYRPTPNRDRQRTVATYTLAMILGDMEPRAMRRDPYFLDIFQGAMDEAAANGYSLTVHVQRLWKDSAEAVRHRFDGHCDGAISVSPLENDETTRALWQRGTPLVTVGSDLGLPDVGAVDMDNYAAGDLAVRHLAELGHRNLAYIGVTDRIVSSRERREGCLQAAAQATDLVLRSYRVEDPTVDATNTGSERGIPLSQGRNVQWIAGTLDQIFREGSPSPTALVCWNDFLAAETIAALEARGLRVPEDISIVGFDAVGEHITSFRQPLYEIGQLSARTLIDLIAGKPAPSSPIRLSAELVHCETVRAIAR